MTTEGSDDLSNNPDEALRRWYQGYLAPANSDSQLTGGSFPPLNRIGEIFDRWFDRRRDDLRALLCGKLGYAGVDSRKKDVAGISTVAVISATLASAHFAAEIDPLATAAVLVSRHLLDSLCDGYTG